MLEQHSDSESAERAKKRKAQNRLHPVNSKKPSSLYELNSAFESITSLFLKKSFAWSFKRYSFHNVARKKIIPKKSKVETISSNISEKQADGSFFSSL